MSIQNLSVKTVLFLTCACFAIPAARAQQAPAAPPDGRPTAYNLKDPVVLDKFDDFRVDAQALDIDQLNVVIPEAIKKQFVDVVGQGGISTKGEADFFATPDSVGIHENVDEIAKLAETARTLIAAGAWEGSQQQTLYGRVLNDYDPTIPAGVPGSEDRAFYERAQDLLKDLPGFLMHVVVTDSTEDSGFFTSPTFNGNPLFQGGPPGEAFPRELPFFSDKAGLLPGVGVIVQASNLTRVQGGWTLATSDMNLPFGGVKYPPCENQASFIYKSRNNPRLEGRVCTGFLLGSSTRLITARHCMQDVNQAIPPDVSDHPSQISVHAEQYAVVFGFKTLANVAGGYLTVFPDENVYFLRQAPTTNLISRADVIELDLDRSVPADVATPFEFDERPLDDSLTTLTLTVAGYAIGLPLSIDSEKPTITKLDEGYGRFFVGGDNYHGDSGAPIFDTKSHKVIGLMLAGLSDFALDPKMMPQCYISNKTVTLADSQEAALHLKSFLDP
ncbi:hypothetical protein HB777_18370 [Mesorhizobium loti]|nr:hypothetical protein HB777_18370 [Mesorhizobium loti]